MNRVADRRQFLKRSIVAAGSAAAVPYLWSSASAKPESKNDRLNVAAIGVGGRGSAIGHQAAGLGNMVACCDVHRTHAEKFAARHGGCQTFTDYRPLLERKDIQAVTIGTPDHWHVAIAIAALKSGKDVYCEKPLTLTIDEGKLICNVVRETKRVFQVGTQQRSDARFLTAIALARSGRLGKILTATCFIGGGPTGGPFASAQPPADLDWDRWLGQAPLVPYTKERCHGTFRWWLEYSGGKLTDWGAHHVDIAQWGLGFENSGPVEVEGRGEFPTIPAKFNAVDYFAGRAKLPNSYNTATKFQCTLGFANGAKIIVRDGPGNGILFQGDQGELFVNRKEIKGKPVEELSAADKEKLDGEIRKLYKGKERRGHMDNFFACVKDRGEPVSDVFSHHRELSSCHMCNLAMLLKRKLRWDPQRQDFVGDDEASRLLSRPQRTPYTIEA